jgi:hypothetical protein
MSDSCTSMSDILAEDSIPEAGAPLESILCTEELQRRPSRQPDYESENRDAGGQGYGTRLRVLP